MKNEKVTRRRYAFSADPIWLQGLGEHRGPWYESPAEARYACWQARRRAVLIAWVRLQMVQRLTQREQQCVELYYFEGLTLEAAGRRTHTNRSSVWRGLQRALRKLRQARDEDDTWKTTLTLIDRREAAKP